MCMCTHSGVGEGLDFGIYLVSSSEWPGNETGNWPASRSAPLRRTKWSAADFSAGVGEKLLPRYSASALHTYVRTHK